MRTNERGNIVFTDVEADNRLADILGVPPSKTRQVIFDRERYIYDFELLKTWKQFDTDQDAWYFGVWVNIEQRMTFTYAEGDRYLVMCPTLDSFRAELKNMEEFYGPNPPAAIGIGQDGVVTQYYDERPSV